MRLAEMTWVQAKEAFARTQLAIVPVGGMDQNGPALPLGMDSIVADGIANRLAERTDAIVTPLVPFGLTQAANSFPGALWVSTQVLKEYLASITECLVANGARRILFIAGHDTNTNSITELARDFQEKHKGVRCALVDWWMLTFTVASDLFKSPRAKGHGGEPATSLMLALREDLVVKSEIKMEFVSPDSLFVRFPEIQAFEPQAERTKSGTMSDPTQASKEDGEAVIARCLDRLEEFVKAW